jgi:hypothetical protein
MRKSNFSEEQIIEMCQLYTKKLIKDVFEEMEQRHEIKFEQQEARDLITMFVDLGIAKGMEWGSDVHVCEDYYFEIKENQENTENNIVQNFVEGKGINGILLPNGKFLHCNNGEHYILAKDMSLNEQYRSIYFSTIFDGQGVISHSPINFKETTLQQKSWMFENKKYFDIGQMEIYEIWLRAKVI